MNKEWRKFNDFTLFLEIDVNAPDKVKKVVIVLTPWDGHSLLEFNDTWECRFYYGLEGTFIIDGNMEKAKEKSVETA